MISMNTNNNMINLNFSLNLQGSPPGNSSKVVDLKQEEALKQFNLDRLKMSQVFLGDQSRNS